MKHTRKTPLWYNPADKNRNPRKDSLFQMASDKEGRALLESYWRLYRNRL